MTMNLSIHQLLIMSSMCFVTHKKLYCILILLSNCVGQLTCHRVYTEENYTTNLNITDHPVESQENTVPVLSVQESKSSEVKEEYWKPWRCTESRLEFLKLFHPLLPNITCPNNDDHTVKRTTLPSNDDQKVHARNIRDEELSSDTDNSNGGGGESGPVQEDYLNDILSSMKKLRGCKWENETHFCHQHIQFVIEPIRCQNKTGVDGMENNLEDGVVDDLFEDEKKPSPGKVWIYGFVCCTLTIVLARVGVIILPLLRKDLYEKLIVAMVGLAAGTLTGSTIFHLLPKAFSLEEKFDDDKEYFHRCTVVGCGLWAFFLLERFLKIIFYHKERRVSGRRQGKVSNVLAMAQQDKTPVSFISVTRSSSFKDKGNPKNDKEQDDDGDRHSEELCCDKCLHLLKAINRPIFDKYRLQSNELHEIGFQKKSQVSTEAWMVIVGDSFLDFVDGLSIGTAFHESILTGLSISLGILLEELPHELGEFAVLLNAGLKFRQALIFKFLSSCTTYLGLCVGIWLGNIEAGPYVFALASGMFLYIALADMIPELNEAALKSSRTSVRKAFRVLFLQNVGLLMGISIIYVMAIYEDVFKKL